MELVLNTINDYFVVVVVLACLAVGYIIKHATSSKKVNKFIPLILAGLGVIVNVWLNKFHITPEVFVSGMLSGLASTGLHQAFKQFIEKSK